MGLYQSNIMQNGLLQDEKVGGTLVTTTYTSGSGSFTIPSNVTGFTVVCIGGGSAGMGGGTDVTGYPGGGAGGFAQSTIFTSSGFTYNYVVGNGGNGATTAADANSKAGQHSTISASTGTLLVRGCGGGLDDIPTIPITTIQKGGGTIVGIPNVGQIKYNGGNGISGAGASPLKKTGGGGGAAGTTGAGGVGTQSDGLRGVGLGGAGTALYGGNGGNSYPVAATIGSRFGNGQPGSSYGGGGGGGASDGTFTIGYGGNGAGGIIVVSYYQPNY